MGGAQRSLLDILERMDRTKFEPVVVVPSSGPFAAVLKRQGIRYYLGIAQRWIFFAKPMTFGDVMRRPWRSLNHPYVLGALSLLSLPIRVFMLCVLVKLKDVRLVYTNTATVIDGALVARLCGIPHVWHLREQIAGNPDLATPFPVDWVPGFFSRWSRKLIVNSRALARNIYEDHLPDNLAIVHNGIDISCYQNQLLPVDLPHIPTGGRVAAICGGVHERKDVMTFLRAAARLRDHYPLLHYFVIGAGQQEYMRKIKLAATQLGLSDHVHFLGYRNDVPALLNRIDVLVSTAIMESFGRTLIEAMVVGKPVIATRSGGPEEIIVEGETGYLVNVGDDEAVATRLSELLDDGDKRLAIGNAARCAVIERFDLRNVVLAIEDIISSALSGTGCT